MALEALHGYSGTEEPKIAHAMEAALGHRGGFTETGPLKLAGTLEEALPHDGFDEPAEFFKALRGSWVLSLEHDGKIFLTRDAAGRRSLYYTLHDGRLLYASEPKAVLAVAGVRRELRPAAVAQFLSFSFVPDGGTMLQGLKSLPPGCYVVFDPASGEISSPQRYFFPEESADSEELDEGSWVEAFRESHARAVEKLVPADPFAVFLSGGIDSSIVTAELAARGKGKVPTFSIHFGKKYPNELEFAKQVADFCHTDHREIGIEPKTFLPRMREFITALDEPIGDPVALPNFELARVVGREFGYVFNGEGGDPLFGGPKNVPMMLHHWYGGEAVQAEGHRERAYLASYRRAFEELSHLLTPEFRREIDVERDLESVLTPFFSAPQPERLIDKLSLINIRLKGAQLILPKVERTLGAHGLTPLSPLFDEELIELSFRIPPDLKLKRGVEKVIMKRAFESRLPTAVIDRPKAGMRVPVYHWMRREMRRYARRLLSPKRLRGDGIFNEKRVRQLLDYSTEEGPGRYGMRLWMLVAFQLWKEIVIDREG